jgi:hypothetical protein
MFIYSSKFFVAEWGKVASALARFFSPFFSWFPNSLAHQTDGHATE